MLKVKRSENQIKSLEARIPKSINWIVMVSCATGRWTLILIIITLFSTCKFQWYLIVFIYWSLYFFCLLSFFAFWKGQHFKILYFLVTSEICQSSNHLSQIWFFSGVYRTEYYFWKLYYLNIYNGKQLRTLYW